MRRTFTRKDSSGFTLVELLVVITIIGVIAGLAIPAIGAVRRTVIKNAMRAELTNIERGIDSYFTRNGDYPPDFSDWNIVRRHYLKIFPDIAQSELNLLYRMCDDIDDSDTVNQMTANPLSNTFDPYAMDRAEAVVWCLGGFSADTQFPFTGPGGPLVRIDTTGVSPTPAIDDPEWYEYNPTRNAPDVSFEPDRLSFTAFDPSAAKSYTNRNESSDEAEQGIARTDVFPHYILRTDASPVVYFDSRTYTSSLPAAAPVLAEFNRYERAVSGDFDVLRPVYSTIANDPPAGSYGSMQAASAGWEFMNARTYQLFGPGLDGRYGDVADSDGGDPNDQPASYFQVDGNMVLLDPAAANANDLKTTTVTQFDVSVVKRDSENPFRDNISNFVDGEFESQIP